jgi:hypothetical protein
VHTLTAALQQFVYQQHQNSAEFGASFITFKDAEEALLNEFIPGVPKPMDPPL